MFLFASSGATGCAQWWHPIGSSAMNVVGLPYILPSMRQPLPVILCIMTLCMAACGKEDDATATPAAAPVVCEPTVTDIDGNSYPVVRIGNQCWMAANLRTTRYNDGSPIPNVTDAAQWGTTTSGAWCTGDDLPANEPVYGKLYNWYTVADPRLPPAGWHVPTDAEWKQMELAIGMPAALLDSLGARGDAQGVGGKLKSPSALWSPTNNGATNETGFSGLPGGYRLPDGSFVSPGGNDGDWWTASESDTTLVWYHALDGDDAAVHRNRAAKTLGFGVRFIRD
jgi:uncharacterized protein (TIGR02145 family)